MVFSRETLWNADSEGLENKQSFEIVYVRLCLALCKLLGWGECK